MRRAYCFCLAVMLLAAPLYARSQDTLAADDDFLKLNLEKLLTLKIDPNMASILDSHIHRAGDWMLSYGFMTMGMPGSDLTTDEILDDFMVAPTSMAMEMHMVSAMYAPTDRLTGARRQPGAREPDERHQDRCHHQPAAAHDCLGATAHSG